MNKGSHIANCLANSDLFLLRNKYDSLSQRSAVFVACEGGGVMTNRTFRLRLQSKR